MNGNQAFILLMVLIGTDVLLEKLTEIIELLGRKDDQPK
jgi:hypothetical protein